jgi:serine/threonine protein kinase/tetratricopeptide (TPR) repeat protein
MALPPGTRLGPYELTAPLGEGGMGEVYRARDARLGRDVAVKVLAERFGSDEGLRERFQREARAIAALSHPNILAIHDVGRDGERAYSVTELLEGETLRQRLGGGPIPARKAVETAGQIAEGLTAAHEHGIVHRDLKPENVFLTKDGRVKILDFGLARVDASDTDRTLDMNTQPGTVLGTVGYMSPEQVRGLAADARSDIFSLGAVQYEMLTGRRAFQHETAAETMTAILHEDPPEFSKIGRISPELLDLVAHCLEKQREERFQTARDLAFALRVAEREDRSGASAPGHVSSIAGAPSGPSIAVLAFRNLSADPENEYLSDGITEEIIGALTRIESLRVASRTSAFAFKGKEEDVRRIGERLGVKTVLEGSLRRAGSRIRVAAQLVDVVSGYHLWSERYDRQMEDVFDLQDELASAIADTLKVRLLGAAEAPLVTPATEDVEAYNHYLKGRYFFNRREPKSAVVELERAISLDPGYAAAYTSLCDAYCVYGFYGGIDTRVAYARGRAAAEKADELVPGAPEVHMSFALLEHYFGWDVPRLDRECRAALAAAPRSAAAHSWLSLGICFHGRAAEAREHAKEACRIEPLSANFQTNVGWTWYAERDFEKARAEFRRALAIDPDALYPLWATGMTERVLGAHEDAVSSLTKAVAATRREQTFYVGLLGAVLAASGNRDGALALKADLLERAERGYVAPLHVLPLLVELGDLDAALEHFARAIDDRNGLAWWVLSNVLYAPLWSDQRFPALAARVAPG